MKLNLLHVLSMHQSCDLRYFDHYYMSLLWTIMHDCKHVARHAISYTVAKRNRIKACDWSVAATKELQSTLLHGPSPENF